MTRMIAVLFRCQSSCVDWVAIRRELISDIVGIQLELLNIYRWPAVSSTVVYAGALNDEMVADVQNESTIKYVYNLCVFFLFHVHKHRKY